MKIVLSNYSGIPIYEQIKKQVKSAILKGTVQPGDMLPSIRQLAKDLQVSVITITRAYRDLEAEGFLATVHGKGCYVLPKSGERLKENAVQVIREHLLKAIHTAKLADISQSELREQLSTLMEDENDEE